MSKQFQRDGIERTERESKFSDHDLNRAVKMIVESLAYNTIEHEYEEQARINMIIDQLIKGEERIPGCIKYDTVRNKIRVDPKDGMVTTESEKDEKTDKEDKTEGEDEKNEEDEIAEEEIVEKVTGTKGNGSKRKNEHPKYSKEGRAQLKEAKKKEAERKEAEKAERAERRKARKSGGEQKEGEDGKDEKDDKDDKDGRDFVYEEDSSHMALVFSTYVKPSHIRNLEVDRSGRFVNKLDLLESRELKDKLREFFDRIAKDHKSKYGSIVIRNDNPMRNAKKPSWVSDEHKFFKVIVKIPQP